ncbi:unnamed protein product [Danaus chrysippus]|uniref:(African queen) hypothetical protein n=1 Tax=Danaus chrysippus TaxID=151541 RepID=A0A8J2W213_9NEOP|nr:unnamed protein product [Danaus chrysippus]
MSEIKGEDYSSGDQDRNITFLQGDVDSKKRSIMTGDTFTPRDMLPIAEKLIKKDFDISGLDALQALAIEGEPVDKTLTEDVTEAAQRMYLRGIPLAKKLPKQRHVIVNQQNTNRSQKIRNKDNKKITRKGMKINKNIKTKTTKVGKRLKSGKASPKCRWNYVCVDPADLDTCRVQTSCGDTSSTMSGKTLDH